MVTTTQGVMIRFAASTVSQTGRATMGVRLIRLEDGAQVATLAKVDHEDEPLDEVTEDVPRETPLDSNQLDQVTDLLDRASTDDTSTEE